MDFRLWPEQASSFAREVDALYVFLLAVSGFFALLILVVIATFAVKYRRRPGNEVARQVRSNLALEVTWIVVPTLIALWMFGFGAKVYLEMNRPPADALPVYVVGKQWMWKVQHPGGQREIDALHVPLGRAVELRLTSQDVIHSFFVPAFRLKMDAVPGRYTSMWFRTTRLGRYHLFCAEYCGTEHSRMIGEVVVMEPEAYQRWLETGAPVESQAEAGYVLARSLGCVNCHGGMSGVSCPPLSDLYGREVLLADGSRVVADESYLLESIVDPGARVVAGFEPVMPSFARQVDGEDLTRLVAWIKSLASGPLAVNAHPVGTDGGSSAAGSGDGTGGGTGDGDRRRGGR